jgi:hypothetical protein
MRFSTTTALLNALSHTDSGRVARTFTKLRLPRDVASGVGLMAAMSAASPAATECAAIGRVIGRLDRVPVN